MPRKDSSHNKFNALEKLGLSENEAELYGILLKYGEVTVQELQKHSPFPRTLIYHILNQLIAVGLVTFIQKPRRTVYIAEDPQRLYDLLAEKEREFERNKNQLRETIPSLRNQYRLSHNRPGIRIFEGIERYREALEDVIHTKPECVYTYIEIQEKVKPGFKIQEQMDKERMAWQIEEKILLSDTKASRIWAKNYIQDKNTSFRFVKEPVEEFSVDLRLYDNKVVQTSYEGKEPMVLMI